MLDIKDILKPGVTLENFKVRRINPNSKKFKRDMARIRKQCAEIEKRKYVDWDKLSRIYITI